MSRFENKHPDALTDQRGEIQSPKAGSYFTNDDHLHLLQLMTRRAMAEHQHRAVLRESDDTEAEARSAAPSALVDVPSRWRLVPEETSLYDWQRGALPLLLSEGRGTVKVATGGGKTLFALAAAQQLQNEREPDLRLL